MGSGDLLNGDAGHILCFAGGLLHEGYRVVRGERWIMTVFLYIDWNLMSGMDAGYLLDEIESLKREKEQRDQSIDKLQLWMSSQLNLVASWRPFSMKSE